MGDQIARQLAPALDLDQERRGVHAAALLLGWAGTVLPPITLFGSRLVPVVALDVVVHRARQRSGDGPELDSDTLAVWEWPETAAPAPAVRLAGALFRTEDGSARGFGRALGEARRWRPFGPAAVLAPPDLLDEEVSRWNCALHGVGLVPGFLDQPIDGAGGFVPAEAGRRAPARRRTADRWIEEILYAAALDIDAFPVSQGS